MPPRPCIDPFFEETTLILRCDVLEPSTMQGYERDPRSLAKRAEAYLKSTGIADSALFGPENEFFIFDNVRYGTTHAGCVLRDRLVRGARGTPSKQYEDGNMGHRPGVKGGYFPVPPVDSLPGHALGDVPGAWKSWASRSKCTTTRWRPPARARSTSSPTRW